MLSPYARSQYRMMFFPGMGVRGRSGLRRQAAFGPMVIGRKAFGSGLFRSTFPPLRSGRFHGPPTALRRIVYVVYDHEI